MSETDDVILHALAEPVIVPRLLIAAPHPDDETIGAALALLRARTALVLHLTDGASHDSRFWTAPCADREEYARLRAREAGQALQWAGVAHRSLPIADQQLVDQIPAAVRALAD